jgi:APA family basic amino acid/polyamine antiporter
VPTVAVVAQGVLGIAFVLVGNLGELIRFAGFTLAVFAALTVGALFVLRARGLRGAYKTFGYPVTPLIFIAVSAWIAYAQIKQNPKESLVVLGVLAVGGLAYYFLVPTPKKTEPLQPPPTLPTARLHDE